MAKGHKPKKIKPERDEAREERISMEIIDDAYGEEERTAASFPRGPSSSQSRSGTSLGRSASP